MAKKNAKRGSNLLEEKIKEFVAHLNGKLEGNFVVAFQFISLDKVNGRNLDWHLYSIRTEEYLEATYKFVGFEEGKERKIKRTVLTLEFEEGPYWVKPLGTSRILEIPSEEPKARHFISRLSYSYLEQELEFDINKPPQSEPPPGKTTSSLENLLDYWGKCLQESIGEGGSLMWVSQKHVSSHLGRITSSVFCLFNEEIKSKSLEYKVSKEIREFIIDHNLELYIAPEIEKIRRLTSEVQKLNITEEEFLNAVRVENPSVILGHEMSQRLSKVRRAVATSLPILITGETGTGKEIIARIIHQRSAKEAGLFIAINCAGFSDGDMLIDSHLFGHLKGAFTNAHKDRMGYFATYSGGTIFLDEIQQLPRSTQGKLKRVVEYKEFTPVGSDETKTTDTRLIFATNRNLVEMVRTEEFLEDFFYRISVIQINIPPLRERMDEIDSLIDTFMEKYQSDFNFTGNKSLESGAREILRNYEYPGNIRELQNVLLRAYVLSADSTKIAAEHIVFDEVKPSKDSYEIKTDADRLNQQKLGRILQSLKLSIDDLQRKHPGRKIKITDVLQNTLNLREEFWLEFSPENLGMTYLKEKNKYDVLRIIELNKPYLRKSLMEIPKIATWLQELNLSL